ncbi:antibiotic biosynthesis monooxygenase family protein [Thalassomonas haliotis]|uniref:Antibiotic biosynthesis monooxygenase n=1 Tax=Thalassomonas haliotis TaxID=485448 RepID=A0ABY7VBQ3_9GAMM|nr:antibiotic biosynthesis monooxygenase [Thalassomonas haliotis]WDE10524.1 antibiotic biosynthesis monooxygenase [Thalassomonas haliotis]
MLAVIFEVCLNSSTKEDYFTLAGKLKTQLENIDGFISVERFQNLTDPDKYLSLSFWQDEQAVKAWRNTLTHRQAQETGRNGIFADYRIRVASVLRDYDMNNRAQSPKDSQPMRPE